MIEKFADYFAQLEEHDYRVTEIRLNQETLDWFLMYHPDFEEGLWGAKYVVVPYERNRVHLEGVFEGTFGPYRNSVHFYLTGNYVSVSVA
jgi:hypothetical protein